MTLTISQNIIQLNLTVSQEGTSIVLNPVIYAGTNITNTSQLVNDGDDGINPFITQENDPIFQTWLATNPLNDFLTSETDPIFQTWLATNPLNGKLDKSTTPSSVYVTNTSGDQTMIPVDEFVEAADFTNHLNNNSNPHNVTKSQIGLGNVDNTSDANKPISIATQTALNGKQSTLVSGTNIKTIEGQNILGSGNIDLTKSDVGLSNVDNTSDLNKPISTATQTALNLKLSIESPSTTGTVISFTTDKVYGTLTTPETGNITADVTNAKLGVTNIIIHNSGTAPTFDSKFKKLSGSGNYATGVVNYIYCTYISATEIIYSINQRA